MLKSINFWRSLCILLAAVAIIPIFKRLLPHQGPKHNLHKVAEKLSLTDSQESALRELLEKNKEQHKNLRKEIHNLDMNFQKKMNDENASLQDIQQAFEAVDQAKSKRGHHKLAMTLKIREIIGADKMEDFKKMRPPGPGKKRRGHRGGPRGRRGKHQE